MKKLRDFKCVDCGCIFESLVNDTTEYTPCECGKVASKLPAAPKFINNSCGENASWK